MEKHPGHEKHMCKMVADLEGIEKIKAVARNAKFICGTCGRSAHSKDNLCNPVDL